MIDVCEIVEKQKQNLLAVASSGDFACRKTGRTEVSQLVSNPAISLYCFDETAGQAVFVQVEDGVDITTAPFLYLAQYEHARRVFAVPFELLHQVATGIESPPSLVFIYTTGRAGSTLLSKVFAAMESVTSLSEPDVFTQAVAMRTGGTQSPEVLELLRSATKLLCNQARTDGSSLSVLKFRTGCIENGDLLNSAFPHAGSLFLYRDLGAFIRSAMRAFAIDETPREARRAAFTWLASMTPLLARELQQRGTINGIEVACLLWLSAVHTYADLRQRGVPMLAVRYEELVAQPRATLATILAHLDLPEFGIQSGLSAFERDSQAGSALSRAETARHVADIGEDRWNLVRQLVRRYPVVGADIPAASTAVP